MITIDLMDRRPIYEQVVEKFEILIVNKVLKENEPMPSVRALAVSLSINPNTIQKAYTILENKGFIYTVSGRGSFVAKNDSFSNKKNEEIKEKLKNNIKNAKMYNINKKEILKLLDEIYEEEK